MNKECFISLDDELFPHVGCIYRDVTVKNDTPYRSNFFCAVGKTREYIIIASGDTWTGPNLASCLLSKISSSLICRRR